MSHILETTSFGISNYQLDLLYIEEITTFWGCSSELWPPRAPCRSYLGLTSRKVFRASFVHVDVLVTGGLEALVVAALPKGLRQRHAEPPGRPGIVNQTWSWSPWQGTLVALADGTCKTFHQGFYRCSARTCQAELLWCSASNPNANHEIQNKATSHHWMVSELSK